MFNLHTYQIKLIFGETSDSPLVSLQIDKLPHFLKKTVANPNYAFCSNSKGENYIRYFPNNTLVGGHSHLFTAEESITLGMTAKEYAIDDTVRLYCNIIDGLEDYLKNYQDVHLDGQDEKLSTAFYNCRLRQVNNLKSTLIKIRSELKADTRILSKYLETLN